MSDFPLTSYQRRRLEAQLRATQDAGIFRRTLAVLEAATGRPVAEIARLLRTSRPSVYPWWERCRSSQDPGSLRDHRGGNDPPLWTDELQALRAASLETPPDHFGYQAVECHFGYQAVEWTAPLLREHLTRWGGTRPSLRSVRRELHQQGYGWKRPRSVLAPDPQAEKKTPDSPRTGPAVAAVGQALRG